MMNYWIRSLVVAIACFLASPAAQAEPKVIASIMPVHSIVAAVMGDLGKPELLLAGRLSEHAASFTPSQIAGLGKADLVFLVGGGLERKLGQLSGGEAVAGKVFVELAAAPRVKTHPIREGGGWEKDEHEDEGLPADPHVWLDPGNAKAMADAAVAVLSQADPGNAALYAANANAFNASLDSLAGEIETALAAVKAKPYIVFHDAYQYFEKRFGLNAVGSIADFSAAAPSARRLRQPGQDRDLHRRTHAARHGHPWRGRRFERTQSLPIDGLCSGLPLDRQHPAGQGRIGLQPHPHRADRMRVIQDA